MTQEKKRGKLVVISGFSGVGKGTVVNRLLKDYDDYVVSVSMTTRQPREGEIDGVHYYFVDEEAFLKNIEEDGFLEHAEVYGKRYGTPKGPILERLEKGIDVLLDIEMQGALQVKEKYPEGVFIFILPPSMAELRKRLTGRGTESPEAIEMRLSKTLSEIEYVDKYDYLVVNGVLEEAVNRVKAIIIAEHSKVTMTPEELIREYTKGEEK